MSPIERAREKATILLEALPYIRMFSGSTMVIKFGGHAMVDDDLKRDFALDVILMKYIGIHPVIVHGGGPQIGELLGRLGIPSTFIGGMRVTDDETMDVVEMVLAGKVRQEIVGLINSLGGSAVGLSGRDGGLITGRKIALKKNDRSGMPPEIIDLGRVGEVVSVNTELLSGLALEKFIPVIAPVGADENGDTLNINADLVAGAVAGALQAKKLILLTDVTGVLRKGRLISSMNVTEAGRLTEDGTIVGGMIPKIACCMTALEAGVEKTHIIDGRDPHSVLLEIFTDGGVGTQIIPD